MLGSHESNGKCASKEFVTVLLTRCSQEFRHKSDNNGLIHSSISVTLVLIDYKSECFLPFLNVY